MNSQPMPDTNCAWSDKARSVYTPNVAPAPLVIDRGEGCYVFDVEGRKYLDAISGIAVSALGHAHPKLVAAIQEQAAKLLHTSNLYINQPAVELASRIQATSFADRVFFCNSGAEANEAAIKAARRYQWQQNRPEKHEIITFSGAFHGRTYGALAATPKPKYHEGFAPMPAGFVSVAYGDEQELARTVGPQTAAILVEPIQGEGGVHVPPSGFLAKCRDLAHQHGALLIADEVQTGFGRTGTLFAHEHEGVQPDIMTMAKGIAAGLPLGAVGFASTVADALQPGTHNTTYSGNPLACRAGLVVMDTLLDAGVLDGIAEKGQWIQTELTRIGGACFKEVRGRGLLIGAELNPSSKLTAGEFVKRARELGLLIHVAGPDVVRIAPPLIIAKNEIVEVLDTIAKVTQEA